MSARSAWEIEQCQWGSLAPVLMRAIRTNWHRRWDERRRKLLRRDIAYMREARRRLGGAA